MGKIILMILKAVAWCLGSLPRRIQLILGSLLGLFLMSIGYRATVVRQNLVFFFNHMKEKGQPTPSFKKLFIASYMHFGNLILEILFLLGPMPRFIKKYVRMTNFENLQQACQQKRGVILLASHVGNWEVMAAAGGLQGVDLLLVTKQLKPAWLHRAIEEGRLRCQVRATYEPKTWRAVLEHLKQGGVVGIVMDQYVGPPVGVRVPCFGVPVGTAYWIAVLVKRTRAPVLTVENFRQSQGNWIVRMSTPLPWKAHDHFHYEIASNTAQFHAAVETQIFDHPEQWLWFHRRFKGDLSPLRPQEWFEPRKRSCPLS